MGDFGAVLFHRFHRLYARAEQCAHAQNCVRMLRSVRTCPELATSNISKVSHWGHLILLSEQKNGNVLSSIYTMYKHVRGECAGRKVGIHSLSNTYKKYSPYNCT